MNILHQTTRQINTTAQKRSYLYDLQDAAAGILGDDHPVASCLRRTVAGAGGVVQVVHNGESASYRNLCTCQNSWVCPHCQKRITARRRDEIENVLRRAHESGQDAIFITCTIRHHLGSALDELLDVMLSAWRGVFSGDKSGARRCLSAVRGQIKSVEIRWGGAGWHPHLHVLVLVDHAGMDATAAAVLDDEIAELIYTRYARTVYRRGMVAERAAYNCQTVGDMAGAVSKYVQKFDASLELTAGQTKDGVLSYSPFQLLGLYSKDEGAEVYGRSAAGLFREYHAATRRRRQISFSRELRELVTIKDDADITPEETAPVVVLAEIGGRLWWRICRWHLRGRLLDIADLGDRDYLQNFLETIRAGDVAQNGTRQRQRELVYG